MLYKILPSAIFSQYGSLIWDEGGYNKRKLQAVCSEDGTKCLLLRELLSLILSRFVQSFAELI